MSPGVLAAVALLLASPAPPAPRSTPPAAPVVPVAVPVVPVAVPVAPVAVRPASEDAEDVSFVPVTVNVGGELLDTRFADMDGDGQDELLLAVRARRTGEAWRREIHIHHRTADGLFPADPDKVVPVLDDVIVYGCADVRPEPGRELVFLTRSGAFSYSPTLDGYRNNIRRLVSQDLLFQVPDERALPSWSYVLPRQGHDLLLLPGTTSLSLWGPPAAAGADGAARDDARGTGDGTGDDARAAGAAATDAHDAAGAAPPAGAPNDAGVPAPGTSPAAAAGDFVERGRWGDTGKAALFSVKAPGAIAVSTNGARVSIDTSDSKSLFLGETPVAFSALLEADVHYRAPALADVNGDGLADLVLRQDNALHIALGTPDGFAPEWSRHEPLPDWLDKPDSDLELKLADLDHDGDTDILARSKPSSRRLQAAVFTYFVLINDGQRLLPAEAQQVLRLEASGTRSEITDVDHDGRPDLVLTKWTLPSVQDLVTGFKLQRASYVYFAKGGGAGPPFERKPSLRDEQSFTLDSLQDALVLRFIPGDLSGDGVADLVEVDLSGRVAVRRIQREGGLFGGGDWSIEANAWKRFDMGADVEHLLLQDLNGDGIADLVNPGARSLMLMISHRTGAGR